MPWPTLHLLRSLTSGWEDADQEGSVKAERWKELPLFDELAHPAIASTKGFETNRDVSRFTIHKTATSKADFPVWEVRTIGNGPGWRTAVISHAESWWSVMADRHTRFHSTVTRLFGHEKTRDAMQPTDIDAKIRALKITTAQFDHDHIEWRKSIAMTVLHGFRDAWFAEGAQVTCDIKPMPGMTTGNVGYLVFEVARDAEAVLTPDDSIVTVFVTINPPAQFFDGIGLDALRTIVGVLEPDETKWTALESQVSQATAHTLCVDFSSHDVRSLLFASDVEEAADVELREPHPTKVAHYVPKNEIVGSVVQGTSMRAACGTWLVSRQNPDGMHECESCLDQLEVNSRVRDVLSGT